MSESVAGASGTPTWPADIIHVNEDGWVLVNRGRMHGVVPGLRLLVVGQGIRDLYNLFAQTSDDVAEEPALRIRRTYEQLDVIHVEERVAIAIATRTPRERHPSVYRGPDGELLVWVPLPQGFTWPQPGAADEDDAHAETADGGVDDATDTATDDAETDGDGDGETGDGAVTDVPPERGEQDDERWEEALPLNGVNVGDIVLPAIPVAGGRSTNATGSEIASGGPGSEPPSPNPFESGRAYD